MKRNPLQTLLQIRQATLDEAQQAVADAYRLELGASRQSDAASAALDREMKTAMNLAGGDDAVETFARWLPIGRRALKQAHDAQRVATAALDRARAIMSLARSGVRTVELLMEQQRMKQSLEEDRREQRVLDEVGSRSSRK